MIIIHANLCTHINTHTHRKSFASSIRIHSYLFYCKNALECGGKYTTACSRYCGSARVRQRVAAIWYVKYFQEFFVSILFIKKKETKKIRSINNQFLNVSLFSYLVFFLFLFFCMCLYGIINGECVWVFLFFFIYQFYLIQRLYMQHVYLFLICLLLFLKFKWPPKWKFVLFYFAKWKFVLFLFFFILQSESLFFFILQSESLFFFILQSECLFFIFFSSST